MTHIYFILFIFILFCSESCAALQKIAETIEEMSIYGLWRTSVKSILSLAHAILNGKCSNLTITWHNFRAELTAIDIEKMVQVI